MRRKRHGDNGGGWLAGVAVRCQPDSRLVSLAREGREPAFEEIVRRYRAPLVAFAGAIAGDDRAEDVVQEALVKAHSAITHADAEIRLRPWLYTVVRNGALNRLRDDRAHEPLDDSFDGVPQPPEVVARREDLATITERLKRLPGPQREALVQRELEGRSHEDIAASMGVSPGAVRGLIFRARTALRDAAGMLIPMPVLRALLSEGSVAGEATGAAGATAAAGLAAGGGGVAVKAGATLSVAVIAVGSGLAIQDRGGNSEDRAHAGTERSHERAGAPGTNGVASGALTRSGAPDEGQGSSSGRDGSSGSSGSSDGDDSGDSGSSGSSGSGGAEGDDELADSSGSGSDGSGSSGSEIDSSGSGSGSSGSGSGGEIDSSGSSGSGSSGSGSSGSGSSGSGSSGTEIDSSGGGSSGSGSSGSDSDGDGSSGSGSSGSGEGGEEY